MKSITVKCSELVYRNPKTFLRAEHAYFPSVVMISGQELLASMVLGSAFESVDCRVHLARSTDGGRTWSLQGPLRPPVADTSEACRLSRLKDGQIVAILVEADRRGRTDMGLTNPDTMGFVPVRLLLYRSKDNGHTWTGPEVMDPPMKGLEFELCSPIMELTDGRLMLPTSTWRKWDGSAPHGMKAVAFVSYDGGKTWPEFVDVMSGVEKKVVYWEQKIIELGDGRMLAVAWTYDEGRNEHLPNSYVLSTDGGRHFGKPASTKLKGQTPAVILLEGSQVFCVYRRMDKFGLWGAIAEIDGKGRWRTAKQECLWAPIMPRFKGADKDTMVKQFHALKLGAPHMVRLPDGDIFVSFWCVEDCVSNIRYLRVRVE